MVWIRILGLDLACIALYIIIMHIIKNYIILSFQNSKNKEEAAAKLNYLFLFGQYL